MEHFRKQAKALVRAYRAGDRAAVERAELVLGARAHTRFLLTDAQHVVAREQGLRTWIDLLRSHRAATVEGALAELAQVERGEALVDSGLRYGDGEPVVIRVRKRLQRYDLDDRGRAVGKGGRSPGWLEVAEEAAEPMNVGRNGAVFVPALEWSHLADLLVRLADSSRAVHEALLDLSELGS
jgi:hypothetical protein